LIDRITRKARHRWAVQTKTKDPLLLFRPDSRELALFASPTAYLWDAESGKQLAAPPAGEACAFSPEGHVLGLVEQDDSVRVWDKTADRLVLDVFVPTAGVNSTLDFGGGRFLIALPNGGIESQDQATVWELATGKIHARWTVSNAELR
jgi:hypothetical protein